MKLDKTNTPVRDFSTSKIGVKQKMLVQHPEKKAAKIQIPIFPSPPKKK